MAPEQTIDLDSPALERAAKYICTLKSGLCPMVEEGFPCQTECGLDTRPWQCWVEFFKQKPDHADDGSDEHSGPDEGSRSPGPAGHPPAHFPRAA